MELNFDELFAQAAERHGHKCPSLYYGVSCGVTALRQAAQWLPEQRDAVVAILEGSSKCVRDGVGLALEQALGITPKIIGAGCGLTLGCDARSVRVCVRRDVRNKINQLHRELSLEEFQRAGVALLRGLGEDELLEVGEPPPAEFSKLLARASQ